jgi:hypothetical protein
LPPAGNWKFVFSAARKQESWRLGNVDVKIESRLCAKPCVNLEGMWVLAWEHVGSVGVPGVAPAPGRMWHGGGRIRSQLRLHTSLNILNTVCLPPRRRACSRNRNNLFSSWTQVIVRLCFTVMGPGGNCVSPPLLTRFSFLASRAEKHCAS